MPAPLAGLLARVGGAKLLGDKGGSGGGMRSNSGMRVSVSVRDGVSEPLKQAGVLLEKRTREVIQRATFHVRNTVVDSIMRESKLVGLIREDRLLIKHQQRGKRLQVILVF